MFKRKQKSQPDSPPKSLQAGPKTPNWLKISLFANIGAVVLIAIGLGSSAVIHQSDTNPQFCGICHLMSSHVESYQTSTNLDNVHAQAGVQCKDCHDYPLPAEIGSAINYVIGNYEVVSSDNPELLRRRYVDEMCLQCHVGYQHIINQTDYLYRNPHLSHVTNLYCADCHISHGEQIDYCSQCHDNGGQRMTGGEIISRAKNPWEAGNEHPVGAPSNLPENPVTQ